MKKVKRKSIIDYYLLKVLRYANTLFKKSSLIVPRSLSALHLNTKYSVRSACSNGTNLTICLQSETRIEIFNSTNCTIVVAVITIIFIADERNLNGKLL